MGNGKRQLRSPLFKKKRTQNFESKTLRDLLLSLFLESIFNTNYSITLFYMMVACVPEHSPKVPLQGRNKWSYFRSASRRKLSLCRSVCYGMGEGSSFLNSDFPSHSPKAASTGWRLKEAPCFPKEAGKCKKEAATALGRKWRHWVKQ